MTAAAQWIDPPSSNSSSNTWLIQHQQQQQQQQQQQGHPALPSARASQLSTLQTLLGYTFR
jgi:hypothetical protein